MSDVQYALSREQLDEIFKAAAAIEDRVKEMVAKPNAMADLLVIWTNLTIIQSRLASLPRIDSN